MVKVRAKNSPTWSSSSRARATASSVSRVRSSRVPGVQMAPYTRFSTRRMVAGSPDERATAMASSAMVRRAGRSRFHRSSAASKARSWAREAVSVASMRSRASRNTATFSWSTTPLELKNPRLLARAAATSSSASSRRSARWPASSNVRRYPASPVWRWASPSRTSRAQRCPSSRSARRSLSSRARRYQRTASSGARRDMAWSPAAPRTPPLWRDPAVPPPRPSGAPAHPAIAGLTTGLVLDDLGHPPVQPTPDAWARPRRRGRARPVRGRRRTDRT